MSAASHPGDDLEGVATIRVPTDWYHRGPMTFVAHGVRIDGNAESAVAIVNGEGKGSLVIGELAHLDRGGIHGDVTFADDGQEIKIAAFVHQGDSSTSRTGASRTNFNVLVQEIDASGPEESACFSRETIVGMRLDPHDTPSWSTKFATHIFGRRALVAAYASQANATEMDSVQVVYEGSLLADDERHALFDVLRFLTAVRGGSFFRETFNGDRIPLGFRFYGHGMCLRDGRRPVQLHRVWRGSQTEHVAQEFPTMVEAMRQLRARSPLAVAATIHHYNDGSVQHYPTSKVRDMSVALEALGVILLGRQAKRTSILDDFEERVGPVREAFDVAFGDLASNDDKHDAYDWISRKFASLNVAGPREELFAALNALDIGLSAKEKSWIRRMRNGILHSGHYGDESIIEDLRVNAQAADLFANVYARAMLRMLGFTGRYRDAVSGTEDLPLNVAPKYPLLL